MRKITITILLIFVSTILIAQNRAYYVKQTQHTKEFEKFTPLTANPIFTKIVVKSNGIEFHMPERTFTFIENNEINKSNEDDVSFNYEISFCDKLYVVLSFLNYPYSTSEPKLIMAIVFVRGLVESEPEKVTYFRLVFLDELVI